MGPELDMETVKQFYMDGWGNLKKSDVAVTIHEAFEGVDAWGDFGSGMSNLLLDTHHYEVFDSGMLEMGIEDHVSSACDYGGQMASTGKWTISGMYHQLMFASSNFLLILSF